MIEINYEGLSALSFSDLTGLVRYLKDEQLYFMDAKMYQQEIDILRMEITARKQNLFII